ncbi:hypothetical protein NQ314_010008 [Rhamnusium bicolor]|uniref:non-specific serine/threonine protein kinase n=1 Tax=Rhamnusium bicolor TaxID=1586634 RepID=A0AAV8XVH4_9CUCU|nr:hypothetical protein NQ314_010008 [Rhamnusium bicolor]
MLDSSPEDEDFPGRLLHQTPLHLSAEHGHSGNISVLLQHNSNILLRDSNGMTPSDLAEKCGHSKCVAILKDASDAKEKARLDIHAAIRDACTQGDVHSVQQLLQSLQKDAELIVNMAPSGANTLLFTACQVGNKEIVKILLEHGADGRYHSVTKYSPLYIACYHGYHDIVELLLLRFPELVQQHTVERWLPIHACCINGHVAVLELLFHFPYPSKVLRNYRDCTEQWEYFMPFDINERDATGQNILYVAALLGNKKLLDVILKFRVKATRISPSDDEEVTPSSSENNSVLSPTRKRISDGIQSIMSKLNLSRENSLESENDPNTKLICPLRIDMYCNNNTETALHAAIKGRHYDITLALLKAGASSNTVIKAYHDINESLSCCSVEEDYNYGQSTGLVEACRNRDVPIVDLLLKHGARDDECKALSAAIYNKDETLIAKLLSTKAHPDPEYKINKKAMTENVNSSQFSIFANVTNLTYSTLFPNTPTMINWHNQKCSLTQIKTQWLIDAALHLNQKLKQNPRSYDIALYAITRLDISNNSLTIVPLAVFHLYSLRYLNIAQNKIEKLPIPVASPAKKGYRRKSVKVENLDYNCPVLEELYLQDNRLDHIPDAIFKLPSLVTLVVSNNKLQQLPYNIWLAPNDSQLSSHTEPDSETETSDFFIEKRLFYPEEGIQSVQYRKKERCYVQMDLTKHHIWSKNVEVTEQILHNDDSVSEQSSQLSALNLAHNLFTSIPVVLPCLAVNLTRLNMAFNSLRSMSHITSYPSSLKQLDLSHNQITVWPSLPQVEAQDNMELANLACYMGPANFRGKTPEIGVRRQTSRSVRNTVLHSVCSHRRHLRLDNLRTLILADNQLTRIQLATDDDGDVSSTEDDELERNKNLDLFLEINELPPQMGLLSRLWNLNTRGTTLQEPLKSMIDSKKYKTMDIIGYLKSVLEDAKPYARMKLMIVGVQGIGKTSLLEQLRQEGVTRRRPEHWAKRMGNKNINVKTSRGTNMSTVGVDIGDWVYEKKYGLTLHMVQLYFEHGTLEDKKIVWRITDGHRGINEILQWLVNIQARAPNSPVIIVGTHYDVVQEFNPNISEEYQQIIRDRFINIVDAEKCGLPRVLDTIEISCKTRHNVKLLCNLIYDTVFSLRPPGSKELLLEQKVPATYLALEDVVNYVATERREINPFARTGVMKLDDLKHIFKASNIGPMDTRGYIVNLLNKFEVALTWDSRTLLIPSLLPSEEDILLAQMYPGQFHPMVKVKVPLRSRGWAKPVEEIQYQLKCQQSNKTMTRLLLMSYFPSGFWSRLISRILADDTIIDIIRSFFILPKEIAQDMHLVKLLDLKAEWMLWQTGLQLKYGDVTLFRMKEVLHNSAAHYRQLRFRIKQEGIWCDVDLQSTSVLEIYFPVESLIVKPLITENSDLSQYKIRDQLIVDPTPECTAQLLALAVDHIDILLEDWYPTLGTRFVHTSEGKFLITRLIPCPQCLSKCIENELSSNDFPHSSSHLLDAINQEHEQAAGYHNLHRIRKSQESYTSECDSGVGPDSAGSSRIPSMEGHPGVQAEEQIGAEKPMYYSWMVEECILAAYGSKVVSCPTHGDCSLARIAPDTIFMDLGERYIIKPENIKKGRLLGRGAFGFVFKGTCKVRGSNNMIDVAMKMLQPVQPGPNARQSALIAFKAAQGKWDRDPLQYACKAYCTARQELNILLSLRHPNIVPFVGVCTSPLALVLDLAPQGALDLVLRHYRRSGAKVGPYTLQAIILQVAKAIEYLHRQHIIYRDLKSENVLVWEMPPPFVDHPDHSVHIKVADYGISRLTLPSGTKGFGGTEGFMAPEIMRYNGEEEYTEKVDCFSFGMFIYELLTLHQPFEGHESVKECILEGGRPPLTYRETLYPSYFLDLMVLCWSQQPKDRPSASQIVSIASAPEFTHLSDVVSLKHQAPVVASTSAALTHISGTQPNLTLFIEYKIIDTCTQLNNIFVDDGLSGSEMWLMCANSRIDLLLAADRGWLQYHTMTLPIRATATCTVGDSVWIGDYVGKIHAYSVSDGRKLFFYTLENEPNTQVEALLYLPSLKRVACALSNGRLFLVNSEAKPLTPTAAEGTFVMTELGSTSIINCMCAVFNGNEDNVWSYVRPGCIVYQWDSKTRSIVNKLDCSKLVPCSESLKSIAIEEHLSPTNCQVTSLVVLNEELYIGTTWGCVIIAERCTLRPITIFRPYEEEVRAIVPLVMGKSSNGSHDNTPLIATIGRGYRNLLSRYTDMPVNAGTPLPSPMAGANSVSSKPNMFILLWRAEHWNAV